MDKNDINSFVEEAFGSIQKELDWAKVALAVKLDRLLLENKDLSAKIKDRKAATRINDLIMENAGLVSVNTEQHQKIQKLEAELAAKDREIQLLKGLMKHKPEKFDVVSS